MPGVGSSGGTKTKEEDGFEHQVGKRPRNKTHRAEPPPFKRSCCREQDREGNGLVDALGTSLRSAALQNDRKLLPIRVLPHFR